MSQSKSPFYVVEDFLSPKQADYIVDTLNFMEPDTNSDDRPIKSTRSNHHCETIVFSQLEPLKPTVEEYFGFDWKGTADMVFEFMPEDCADGMHPHCGNSVYNTATKRWVRNKNYDFTGVIFLSDYNTDSADNFDPNFEVYGGKLQFPQYGFSFQAKRGTLVVFPAGPNFVHAISPILAGDLFMVSFQICAERLWPYDPKLFPGTFKTWFT